MHHTRTPPVARNGAASDLRVDITNSWAMAFFLRIDAIYLSLCRRNR